MGGRKGDRSMTLKEIARRAGVSVSTVSRVVNSKNAKAASPEVCERIWQIVRETGYTPNSSAQCLQQGGADPVQRRGGKIYVIFSRKVDTYIDPFFMDLMHAIEVEAFSRGYPIQTIMSDIEMDNLNDEIIDKHSAGIILGQISEKNLALLKKQFRHLAYVGLNALPESAMVDQILCSGYKAARLAVAYLAQLGHRRIFYIGETENEERYQGYLDEMKHRGLDTRPEYVRKSPLSPQGGYDSMVQLLNGKWDFTAVFCANDDTAVGAVRALTDQGVRVPERISVIGMDDIEMSRYLSPMLTTVHIPTEDMGKQSAKVVIDRMEGGHKIPMKIKFPASISPRESCTSPKK